MIGDYVIQTKLGEIRQLPSEALGYCNVEDYIVGRIVSENPSMIRLKTPYPFFSNIFSDGMSDVVIPLKEIESFNEYYYGWNATDKDSKVKLAELILGRKILATRKK